MAVFFLYVCNNSEQIVLYSLVLRASAPVIRSKAEWLRSAEDGCRAWFIL